MLREIRTKKLVLSPDHDKRDKEIFKKRVKILLDKRWEQIADDTFQKKIDIRA